MQYAQPAGLWRGKGARPACKDLTINIAAELLPVASINHELKLKAGLRKTFWLCPPPPLPMHAMTTCTLYTYSTRYHVRFNNPTSEWFILWCVKIQFNVFIFKTKVYNLSSHCLRMICFDILQNINLLHVLTHDYIPQGVY